MRGQKEGRIEELEMRWVGDGLRGQKGGRIEEPEMRRAGGMRGQKEGSNEHNTFRPEVR